MRKRQANRPSRKPKSPVLPCVPCGESSRPHPSPIPKTAPLSAIAASIKSNVRNILLASPDFPRLYADVVLRYAPNSNAAKILAPHYKKIIERTSTDFTNNERTNQTTMPNTKICTHIKVTGVRCGSPALRGEQFCYFHQRMIATVKSPDSRLHHIALLEDEESIQASVMEVVNGLIRGTLELKRAELILRALNTAVRNSRRVHFSLRTRDMVREVPDYPAPPNATPAVAQPTGPDFPPVAATKFVLPEPVPANVATASAATAHVGTDAFVRPGGPEVPGRSAIPLNPSTSPDIRKEPAAEVSQAPQQRLPHSSQSSKPGNAQPDPTRRKPPLGLKEAAAPKERKIAAHRASGG